MDNDGYYYKWNAETRTYEKTDASIKGDKGDAFRYEDFTPEQVSALRAPATDAAAEVARRLMELTDEEDDIATAEAQREASVRNALEDIAEASGKADTATEAANTAAALANQKLALAQTATDAATTATTNADAATAKANDTAAHPGYVDNDGYYYKWNAETRTYEKTDVNLKG